MSSRSGNASPPTPTGDIDVFVVRSDDLDAEATGWVGDIEELQRMASQWTGNDVRVLEMAHAEVVVGLDSGEAVLEEIRRDGLTLFGNSAVLRSRPTQAKQSHRGQAGRTRGYYYSRTYGEAPLVA